MPDTPELAALSRQVAHDLAQGDVTSLAALFSSVNVPTPLVVWSPKQNDLPHNRLRSFADRCDMMETPNRLLPQEAITPEVFGALQEWLMILKYDANGALVFHHYGHGIAQVYGRDMTGCSTASFTHHISAFFNAVYAAAGQRRERVFTVHQPPNQVFARTWSRLIVPMVGNTCDITGFVALNLPENALHAGLEALPVPVMIMDQDEIVRYANREAREDFDGGIYGPWDRSLFDYCGIDLQMDTPPGELVARTSAISTVARQVLLQRIHHVHVRISGILHHGTAFYLVMLLPDPP